MKNIVSLEEGTCTDRAVKHFLAGERENRDRRGNPSFFDEDPTIIHQPTFDEMIAFAKANPGTVMLIPHLRTDISAKLLYTVEPWKCIDEMVFTLANPPLYLAGKEAVSGQTCATLAQLQGLVRQSLRLTFIPAKNTQDAARQVHAKQADLCVTNENGVQAYQLEVREQLKKMVVFWMPWVYERTT